MPKVTSYEHEESRQWVVTDAGRIAFMLFLPAMLLAVAILAIIIINMRSTIVELREQNAYHQQCSLEVVLCPGEEVNIEIQPRGQGGTMQEPIKGETHYDTHLL